VSGLRFQKPDNSLSICRAIDRIPRTIVKLTDNIRNQTGCAVTILVGGPEPKEGGEMMSYM